MKVGDVVVAAYNDTRSSIEEGRCVDTRQKVEISDKAIVLHLGNRDYHVTMGDGRAQPCDCVLLHVKSGRIMPYWYGKSMLEKHWKVLS